MRATCIRAVWAAVKWAARWRWDCIKDQASLVDSGDRQDDR